MCVRAGACVRVCVKCTIDVVKLQMLIIITMKCPHC